MLRSYIGDRESGFLFETEGGKMLSKENLWRDGFATIVRKMGRAGRRPFSCVPAIPRGGLAVERMPGTPH
jgi:hypothetical protein